MMGRTIVAGALLAMLGACSVQTRTVAGEDECAVMDSALARRNIANAGIAKAAPAKVIRRNSS